MFAASLFELAQVHEARPAPVKALEQHQEVLARRQDLAERDAANAGARIEVAQSHAAIGRLQIALGRRAAGRDSLQKSNDILQELKASSRINSVGEDELKKVQAELAN
jgi:hypothetical protein